MHKDQNIILMARRDDPFARVTKSMLNDAHLSWRAKGILSYLLGKPAGWKMRVTDLVRHSTDGERAVRAALAELREHGYADLSQLRDNQGKILEWVWKVSDSAIFGQPDCFSPHVGSPHVVKGHISKKEISKSDGIKTASLESEESKRDASPSGEGVRSSFAAQWSPIQGTKSQQLARIRPPGDYPTEDEFDELLEDNELDHLLMGKRGNLYEDMCRNKWQHWNGRRWNPIHDWRAYVTALDTKIEEASRN